MAYNFVTQQQMKEVMMMTMMMDGCEDYDDTNDRILEEAFDEHDVQAIAHGEFIEHATFAGNTYGTSTIAVQRVRDKGQHNFHFHF